MKKRISPLLLTLGITGFSFVNVTESAVINMCREAEPLVEKSQLFNFIVDKEKLHLAFRTSGSAYLFSQFGTESKPLILTGTPIELIEYFLENQHCSIKSNLPDWPDIYLGITRYVPGKRFLGLFPPKDLLIMAVEQAQKYLPGKVIKTDNHGTPADLAALKHTLNEMEEVHKSSGPVFYLKLSYKPEDGMSKIGKESIIFAQLLQMMQLKEPVEEAL